MFPSKHTHTQKKKRNPPPRGMNFYGHTEFSTEAAVDLPKLPFFQENPHVSRFLLKKIYSHK